MAVDRRVREPVRACALLAVLAFVLSAQVAVSMAPFFKTDERANAAYAIAVAHGQLPTIQTPIADDPVLYPALAEVLANEYRGPSHLRIWTANHPPLYYVLSAPLVMLGDAIGHPGLSLFGMRLLNGLGFALAVFLVGMLARELVPRRPGIAVLSSAFALSCGAVTYVGGAIYNDGVATALAFLALLLGVRTIRHGVTRPRLVATAVAGAAAAATRASGIPVVAVVCLAVLAASVLADRTPRGWRAGTLRAAAVGSVAVIAIGWFYVRNLALYGSVTASSALYQQFDRTPNGSWLLTCVTPSFYWRLLTSLWTDGDVANQWRILAGILLAAGLAGLAEASASRRPRGPERIRFTPTTAAWGVAGLYVAANVVSVAQFIAGGGWIHARYALPLLPLLGIAVASGLLYAGRRLSARDDSRLVTPLTLLLVGLGLLCHLDTLRHVTAPVTDGLHLAMLLSAWVVLGATAVLVVRGLVLGRLPEAVGAPEPALTDSGYRPLR
ncbi:MAG: hypothetical protein QM572_16670 [Nocardioides sp.]|uniref:hypothetical protein n=1 Tax=Nocardioides sp. TaxID=35761 RepID=UPI0039E4FE6E